MKRLTVGNKQAFALACGISETYRELSLRALGYFVIYVGGRRYGVYRRDATHLACSVDEVARRLAERGSHVAPFANAPANDLASELAQENSLDQDEGRSCFGLTAPEFYRDIAPSYWAPDGDAAFDDSSRVLQFDVGDRVRLVAFRVAADYRYVPGSLREVWLAADDFYGILRQWHEEFRLEWERSPKAEPRVTIFRCPPRPG